MSTVVMLPPVIDEIYADILKGYQEVFEQYEKSLISRLERDLFDNGWRSNPSPTELWKMQRDYLEDPMRQRLLVQIAEIKALAETPVFKVSADIVAKVKEKED